jgi:hypothetical protein
MTSSSLKTEGERAYNIWLVVVLQLVPHQYFVSIAFSAASLECLTTFARFMISQIFMSPIFHGGIAQ